MVPDIPKMMKAAQLMGYKQPIAINEVPIPEVGDNDVLVKVGAAGWCHTDYQVWEGVYGSKCPLTHSHEPVGTVAKVGSKVSKFRPGDRVGVLLFQNKCGKCTNCGILDDIRFCSTVQHCGLNINGGMAEYIISGEDSVMFLPDGLEFEQAAPLMCAGATVWGGIHTAGISPSDGTLGIIGIGGLGSLAVQFGKALGYTVVAIDDRKEGQELATELTLKADLVVDFNDKGAADKVKEFTTQGGLAAVVVCTDDLPAITWSLSVLRAGGEKTVKGSLVSTTPEVEKMLKVVHEYNIRSLVTTVTLDEVPQLPQKYMDPHLKGCLVMKIAS